MGPKDAPVYYRKGKLHFYCPLCHHHQSTNTIQKVSWKHHLQMAVLTVTVMFAAWPLFGFNAACFYFFFWALFELFYRARKRQALICESCGFDPFLYKRSVKKARTALRKHWENRIAKENLFAGVKLKNYQTNPLPEEAAAPPSPPAP